MTIEVHHVGDLKTVEQLQIACAACGTTISYMPTQVHTEIAKECPNCNKPWFTDGRPTRRAAVSQLAWLLKEIAESEIPFVVRLDFGSTATPNVDPR